MKRFELQEPFGIAHLALVDRPDPEPGPGQVLLRMRAVSLNYRDLPIVRGQYDKRRMPRVPLSDGVGEVLAVGAGVTRVAVGARVNPTFIQEFSGGPVDRNGSYVQRVLGGPLDGTLTEMMIVSAEGGSSPCPKTPQRTSKPGDPPGAPVSPRGTALAGHGCVRAGDTVVVQGTRRSFVVRAPARPLSFGARVIVLSSSDDKLARARALGADVVINYKTVSAWAKVVQAATGGDGADHIVDVGGSATLNESIEAVRAGGTITLVGGLGGMKAEVDLPRVFVRNIRLQGIFVGSRRNLEDLGRALRRRTRIIGARNRPRVRVHGGSCGAGASGGRRPGRQDLHRRPVRSTTATTALQ